MIKLTYEITVFTIRNNLLYISYLEFKGDLNVVYIIINHH